MVTIVVSDLIKGNLDHEDGSRLYHVVKPLVKNSEIVVLDFSGVEIVSSSFLNTSFRLWAADFSYEHLSKYLKIINSTKLMNEMIRARVLSVYEYEQNSPFKSTDHINES